MKLWKKLAVAGAMLAGVAGQLQAQISTQPPLTGVHPESHGPQITTADTGDDKTVVVTGKHLRRPGLLRRVGHFFHRIFHGKRRWYTTPSHRNHCKQKFRSYNPRTNSYRAYSGVIRKCVI